MKTIFAASVAMVAALACSPASAEVFDGPYLGGQVGWNHDKIGRANTDIGSVEIRDSKDSFTGGVFAGYNHKVAPKVVRASRADLQSVLTMPCVAARPPSIRPILSTFPLEPDIW